MPIREFPNGLLDEKYTPQEAKDIFAIVGAFMRKLASRMDENGDPKA